MAAGAGSEWPTQRIVEQGTRVPAGRDDTEASISAVHEAAWQAIDAAGPDTVELAAAIRATGVVLTRRDLLVLPLLTARATGGDPDQAVLVAAAHHLSCLAAVILDDIQDGQTDAVAQAAPGGPQAINIGLALVFAAQCTLARLTGRGATPAQVMALQTDFAQTGYRVCAGQHLDLTVCHAHAASPLEAYWRMAAAKSGAFYALGARAGARLGIKNPAALAPYTDYGHHLGLMVQVVNDLRSLLENHHTDLRQGKHTLPVAYGLTVAPEGTREALLGHLAQARTRPFGGPVTSATLSADLSSVEGLRAYPEQSRKTDPDAVGRAAEMLIELGALHYTLMVVEQHRRHAVSALAQAPGDPAIHEQLVALLDVTVPDLSASR